MKKDDKSLGKIIAIIKRINPQEVYLFGSHANGSFDEQSDIDLLIIAPSIDRPSERRMKLRKELSEFDRSLGLDLLVYTPDEYKILVNEPSSFLFSAIKQGIKIYDHENP